MKGLGGGGLEAEEKDRGLAAEAAAAMADFRFEETQLEKWLPVV